MPISKIERRLNSLLNDTIIEDVETLLNTSKSRFSFNSRDEFAKYLTEGSLLNVNTIGSQALSIPCGEYMVWVTEANHTMLIPTTESQAVNELYQTAASNYELVTSNLLNHWNKFERTLAEEPTGFNTSIDQSSVDRMPILQAMKERGMTETELASEVGVDVPAISRILRIPKVGGKDPGGRNPSMELASKICGVLKMDPSSAFPDFFNTKSNRIRESVELQESLLDETHAIQLYESLCEILEESGKPFDEFWESVALPVFETTKETSLSGVLTEFIDGWGGDQQTQAANAKFAGTSLNRNKPAAQQVPSPETNTPYYERQKTARDERRQQATKMVSEPIKKVFSKKMQDFLQSMHNALYKINTPSSTNGQKYRQYAPHIWELSRRLYDKVIQLGDKFLGGVAWDKPTPGMPAQYRSEFNNAYSEWDSQNNPNTGTATQ